ncbi:putative toxin [Gordonia polyisoprenivorans NBRC 16320 = JCM 10675]|uniref:type II toxin-antitoxin system YoeB family toxin n=1 Tax=Gordonia polyisoprenivorans TaxID=84595 RepID=UPI00023A8CC5|nr:putative toxin [Gordonia polyisoprenivorans NBRC 16320 = JCM 10675]
MRLVWDQSAWEDYVHWQSVDRRLLTRINTLLDACLRDAFTGIGKPEPLTPGRCGITIPTLQRTPSYLTAGRPTLTPWRHTGVGVCCPLRGSQCWGR